MRTLVIVLLAACSFERRLPGTTGDDADMPIFEDAPAMSGGEPAATTCMPSYTMTHGTSRYRVGTASSWYAAEASCESDGGHLVVIDDAAENAFVLTFDPPDMTIDLWLGGSDHNNEDTFLWVTGGTIAQSGSSPYQNWQSPQPNNAGGAEDCMEMNNGGGWNDNGCGFPQPFVCECDTKPIAMNPKTYCETGTMQHCESCGDFCALGCNSAIQICL